jgi:hypothetical protein
MTQEIHLAVWLFEHWEFDHYLGFGGWVFSFDEGEA